MFPPDQQSNIDAAATLLLNGGVVALPTETVYGLAADATNEQAVKRIFEIKGRPADHQLILHIANEAALDYWASEVPDTARLLARQFWPGPLTLILPRSPRVSSCVTGGQETVGLRIPDHPVTLAVLRAMGPHAAVAAPSANRYGRISPTTAEHVREELGDRVDMIVDGGSCNVGLESTIVSCIGDRVAILRPGGIPVSAIENVLQHKVDVVEGNQEKIRVSGSLLSHYAPATPLELAPHESFWQRASELEAQGKRLATVEWSAPDEVHSGHPNIVRNAMPANPAAYGHLLYATLRRLDHAGYDCLLVEAPPQTQDWLAVTDRLKRASYKD
jgi:L-threonylcarbamoyladenylate synthase